MPIVHLEKFLSAQFDFLIIGGGTSGLVTAARLSEDSNITVGVIEAGDYHVGIPGIDVPGMMGQLIANPSYDWTFLSVPQESANGRVVLQPRGKGLGGSSLLNFTGLSRPSREEYDALEELGNPGWNWEEMLKYTKKGEKTIFPNLSTEQAHKYAVDPAKSAHGTDGPLVKSFPTYPHKINASLLDTFETMGIPRNGENGNGHSLGSITTWMSIDPRTAKRAYAANAYYNPNASRENLMILTGAHVSQILFAPDSSNPLTAVGVEIITNGKKWEVTGIKKDVVVSCGAFQTPQLLELSGIGNSSILKKFNIEQKLDLPGVGENLQDHVLVPTIALTDGNLDTIDILSDPINQKEHELLYESQQGLLSSVPAQIFAYVPAQTFQSVTDTEEWETEVEGFLKSQLDRMIEPTLKAGLLKQYELQKRWLNDNNQAQAEALVFGGHFYQPDHLPLPGKRYVSILWALMHPLSRGSVHITSSDPLALPAIDPNYFGNPADLHLLTRLLKFGLKMYQTKPLSNLVVDIVLPQKDIFNAAFCDEDGELKELEEYAKNRCGPVYHPLGTAAMMPKELGGVVDSKLKVYGTTNLRIVDLSIFPMEVACHTQSTAYAIGEKAADIIKADYNI